MEEEKKSLTSFLIVEEERERYSLSFDTMLRGTDAKILCIIHCLEHNLFSRTELLTIFFSKRKGNISFLKGQATTAHHV